MKQQLVELERIHFARAFPWVHLFRAFRLALDVRKMILGALALSLLGGGLFVFSYFPLDFSEPEIQTLRQSPWVVPTMVDEDGLYVENIIEVLARPLIMIWQPASELVDVPMNWSGAAMRWTQILFALCVWSFFGTAIARMSAVQFAVDQRISFKEAITFAGTKWHWVISAPLMPLAGVLFLWLGCMICGWIGLIPGAGPVVLGVLWIVPLLLSFAIVLLLIGLALGWPLMVATISVEGSDAFDGFSRSFDYVYSRFWHVLWLILVASVHGFLMLAFVAVLVHGVTFLAAAGVGVGLDWDEIGLFAEQSIAVWTSFVVMLLAGYTVSYFWSANTIMYFLLRQSEDASHLSEVYLPKEEPAAGIVQLAGVAASDQPVIERPSKHDPETRQPGSETDIHD